MDNKRKYIAIIQAGGKGTRMRSLTHDEIPKPLLSLNGKPMIQWQIEGLRDYGIHEFVIIAGHLGEKISEHFGDGASLGVQIHYVYEDANHPLGSAGALYEVRDFDFTDAIVIFGDVMFCIDWNRMISFHESHASCATLLVHPNSHPQDSDLLQLDANEHVTGILSKHDERKAWYDNCVNAGIYILSKDVIASVPGPGKASDMESDVLLPLMRENAAIYGYHTPEYVKDVGTPERFFEAWEQQAAGVWDAKCLKNKQKAIFLDRDGTLNIYRGLIADEDALELEANAAEAVREINAAGYLAILITNQPVVARGMCEIEDVQRIHKKLQTLLGQQAAYLDDIAFCPHHPDKGYPEENPLYKIDCDCRKPKTGMVDKMLEKYNIDPEQSWFVGDSTIDIQTGKNARLRTALVKTGVAGTDGKYDVQADIEAADLLEAVKKILQSEFY